MDEKGQWRSVKTLDQFWEMMSYRQECSAGRLVGFLWMVFSPGKSSDETLNDLEQPSQQGAAMKTDLITPGNSQQVENDLIGARLLPLHDPSPSDGLYSPPASSPIHLPELRPGGWTSGNSSSMFSDAGPQQAPEMVNVTKGELVLDEGQYDTLMEFLLQTDFAGEALAEKSSRGWIDKACELSGVTSFGLHICGEHDLPQPGPDQPSTQTSPCVNVLTGIKKRKAEQSEPQPPSTAINVLSAGLVRKKAKS
jgi:regulator of Ty1 transposition protein 109